ncbi:MAG: hypothetical protein ACKOTB_18645, partial [Planctomycetia bacterium]
PLPDGAAVEAARCLELRFLGRTAGDSGLASACGELHAAMVAADCVALVTRSGGDGLGLGPWSLAHLVRTIAHGKAAFQVPLGAGLTGPGPDVAGAAAVCTWRYGAAGAIARADRAGRGFAAAEADARRLVARGEVDAILALGPAREPLASLLEVHADPPVVVRIEAGSDASRGLTPPLRERDIAIRCAPAAASGGTMLREDGREVRLTPFATTAVAPMHEMLRDLHEAVRLAVDARARGTT